MCAKVVDRGLAPVGNIERSCLKFEACGRVHDVAFEGVFGVELGVPLGERRG